MRERGRVLRLMQLDDVDVVVGVQEPAAVAGLGEVFPQDTYPFPRAVIADRWRTEVLNPDIECFVIEHHGAVAGFAAVRNSELLHFGVALEEWGSGLAVTAHEELVEILGRAGGRRHWLCVYAGNARGGAFWEKVGWRPTGERRRGVFPPYAELLVYESRPAQSPDD